MNAATVLSRIKSLEIQLEIFQKELKSIREELQRESSDQGRCFGDLYGVLKGVRTSEKEIENVKRQWEPKVLS